MTSRTPSHETMHWFPPTKKNKTHRLTSSTGHMMLGPTVSSCDVIRECSGTLPFFHAPVAWIHTADPIYIHSRGLTWKWIQREPVLVKRILVARELCGGEWWTNGHSLCSHLFVLSWMLTHTHDHSWLAEGGGVSTKGGGGPASWTPHGTSTCLSASQCSYRS